MNKRQLEQHLRLIGVKATEAAKMVREEQVGWTIKIDEIEVIIFKIVKEYLNE